MKTLITLLTIIITSFTFAQKSNKKVSDTIYELKAETMLNDLKLRKQYAFVYIKQADGNYGKW